MRFSSKSGPSYFSIDLFDFLEKLAASDSRPEIRRLIRPTQQSLLDCILAEDHAASNSGSHGLSIYFPLPPNMEFQTPYSDPGNGLDFAADTAWARLLQIYKNLR